MYGMGLCWYQIPSGLSKKKKMGMCGEKQWEEKRENAGDRPESRKGGKEGQGEWLSGGDGTRRKGGNTGGRWFETNEGSKDLGLGGGVHEVWEEASNKAWWKSLK